MEERKKMVYAELMEDGTVDIDAFGNTILIVQLAMTIAKTALENETDPVERGIIKEIALDMLKNMEVV